MRTLILFVTVCLTLGAPSLPAQHLREHCPRCKGEGLLPCKGKYHNRKKICGVTYDHKCDAIFTAPCCHGLLKVICPICKDPVVAAQYQEALDERKAWVDRQRKIDRKTGIRFSHVETEHFRLHSSLPRYKRKDQTLNRVKAAHLFMGILMRTAKRFQEITGTLPVAKQEVFLVPTEKQNLVVTLHMFGVGQKVSYKLYSDKCKVCTWPKPPELRSWRVFEAHVCHLGAHELIHAAVRAQLDMAAWLDLGLAHWLENDLMHQRSTFCFREVLSRPNGRWATGKWKKMIYREVLHRHDASFADIIRRDTDNMRHREHAYCWSFVDFLIKKHPAAFKKLFTLIKRTNNTKQALDQVLNWSSSTLQEKWQRYVRANYQPQ